jgi:hypothetical protein
MRKRGNACGCIQRFLAQFPALRITEMAGMRYEDDVCSAECSGGIIRAYAYELVNGARYKIGECIMTIW